MRRIEFFRYLSDKYNLPLDYISFVVKPRYFYKATIKGWEYAFENIEESVKIIHEKYNSQNKSFENLFFEANEMQYG